MNNQLFIPDRLKVGFDKRKDTYTGQLAYVIYYDKKGVLRKEASFETWRDKKIATVEYDNTPIEGFVLNKGVGGTRGSYSWNARMEKIRTYDPRDFEIELSIPNVLFILRECNCMKGKGLEGKFVYAWWGTELILLPVDSEEYRQSTGYTALQGKSVKAKELVIGATYITKRQKQVVYLGTFDYFFSVNARSSKADAKGVLRRKVFWNESDKKLDYDIVKDISTLVSAETHPDFAKLVDTFNKSPHSSRIIKFMLKPGKTLQSPWFYEETPGVFVECHNRMAYDDKTKLDSYTVYGYNSIVDGVVKRNEIYDTVYPAGHRDERYYGNRSGRFSWRYPTGDQLYAELENGRIVHCKSGNFYKER